MTYQFYYNLFFKHGLDLNVDTEMATTDQILPLVKYLESHGVKIEFGMDVKNVTALIL